MTDRELLELAAKAAGIEHVTPMMIKRVQWNPLTDDGDALRLMVRLRLDINFEKLHTVSAWSDPQDDWLTEQCEIGDGMGEGIELLTRRVITRAAAEIGKAMQ